jgi:ATP-dependent Clp protease ATP-binding subunit ClpC
LFLFIYFIVSKILAIQAIMLAQEEAKRFHHSYVGTEHILLGIIGEGDNVVVKSIY